MVGYVCKHSIKKLKSAPNVPMLQGALYTVSVDLERMDAPESYVVPDTRDNVVIAASRPLHK
jgi:hypothetical protein